MVAPEVVASVREYLAALARHGIPASFGVVYGSRARGDDKPDSDIDLVVVSPHFDSHRDAADVEVLWRAKLGLDWRIEPVACGLREWAEDDSRAVLEIARREGNPIVL